jgi:hypothetical protein
MGINITESTPSHENIYLQDDYVELHERKNIPIYSETTKDKNIQNRGKKSYKDYSSYEQPIRLLRSLRKQKVSFQKMLIIASISTEITESVNYFWRDMQNIVTSSLLNIDADDLMTIFIYIIIKSNMTDLLIHSKFIKEFTTNTTQSTMVGYYYTTLEASLTYLLEIKDKQELIKKEKRLSLLPGRLPYCGDDGLIFSTLGTINNQNNIL